MAIIWWFFELQAMHGVLSLAGLARLFWLGVALGVLSLAFGRRK